MQHVSRWPGVFSCANDRAGQSDIPLFLTYSPSVHLVSACFLAPCNVSPFCCSHQMPSLYQSFFLCCLFVCLSAYPLFVMLSLSLLLFLFCLFSNCCFFSHSRTHQSSCSPSDYHRLLENILKKQGVYHQTDRGTGVFIGVKVLKGPLTRVSATAFLVSLTRRLCNVCMVTRQCMCVCM